MPQILSRIYTRIAEIRGRDKRDFEQTQKNLMMRKAKKCDIKIQTQKVASARHALCERGPTRAWGWCDDNNQYKKFFRGYTMLQ